MTEDEYILATNKAKLSAAIGILRDMLPGYGWGIDKHDMYAIMNLLKPLEERLIIEIDSIEYKENHKPDL